MNGAESVQVIATLVAAIAILGWVITSLVRSRNNKPSSGNPGTAASITAMAATFTGMAADIGVIKERLLSILEELRASNKRQEDALGRIERKRMPRARKK